MNIATFGIDVGKPGSVSSASTAEEPLSRGALQSKPTASVHVTREFRSRRQWKRLLEARLARDLIALSRDARLISAKFVRPFLKGNKNDYVDAEAICRSCPATTMRFVPAKTAEQLDLQAIHRIRSGLISRRTGDQLRSDRCCRTAASPSR